MSRKQRIPDTGKLNFESMDGCGDAWGSTLKDGACPRVVTSGGT